MYPCGWGRDALGTVPATQDMSAPLPPARSPGQGRLNLAVLRRRGT